MSARRLVDDYLAGLDAALELPRRRRERVVAEAADHLLCAAEHHHAAGASSGDAQRAAIDDFGPAPIVAMAHMRAAAVEAARRLAPAVVVAFTTFAALVAAAQGRPAIAAGAAGAIAVLAVQVAAVSGALTVVRVLRHRGDAEVPAGKLRLIGHGAAVTLAGVTVSLVAISVALLGSSGPGTPLALLLGLCIVATIGLAAGTAAAWRRVAAIARDAEEPAAEDAWDDLAALAGRLPPAGLRRHPWRVAATTAVAAGLAAALGHLVAEGPPADGLADLAAVTAILVALEGAAVLGCFALLGRYLGIRATG